MRSSDIYLSLEVQGEAKIITKDINEEKQL